MKKTLSMQLYDTEPMDMKGCRHSKHYQRSKRQLCQALLLVALTIMSLPGKGQTFINNSNCIGTITRSDPYSNLRVHYVKTGSTSGKFLFGLTQTGYLYQFSSCPVSGYNINDFTILNDTVYFCGEDEFGVGFYGWTSTSGLSWDFNIYKLYGSSNCFITNVKRIRAFRSGQELNVLLIGTYKNGGTDSYGSILHIKNNLTCTLAFSKSETFNDVAVLNNHVVTIAQKGNIKADGHVLRVLHKLPFSLYDPLFDIYYSWGEKQSFGRLWLQATDSNRLVSVYRDGVGYYFNTYSVNSSGSLAFHKYYSVATSTMPTINDVEYNRYSSTLAILHNIDTVGTASLFDCSSFLNITLSSSIYPNILTLGGPDPQTKLLSVTKLPSSPNFAITGICQNHIVFWNTTSQNCKLNRYYTLTSDTAGIEHFLLVTERTTIDMEYQTYKVQLESFIVSEDCL